MEKSTATVHLAKKAYTVSSTRGLSYVERVAQLVNVRAAKLPRLPVAQPGSGDGCHAHFFWQRN